MAENIDTEKARARASSKRGASSSYTGTQSGQYNGPCLLHLGPLLHVLIGTPGTGTWHTVRSLIHKIDRYAW